MTELRKEIEQAVAHTGYAVYIKPNGTPDYVAKETLANFACLHFIEKHNQHYVILEDDGGKEVPLNNSDELNELVSSQTFNRGDFFDTKEDCQTHLDYSLECGNITKEQRDSLVDDLKNC